MKRAWLLWFYSTLMASVAFPAASTEPGRPSAHFFIVHYSTGPGWLPGTSFSDQPHARAHSENVKRLRDEGLLVLGARYIDKGMLILQVSSEAEAKAEIEKDPSIGAGVFEYEIAAFRPFYDGCVERQAGSASVANPGAWIIDGGSSNSALERSDE